MIAPNFFSQPQTNYNNFLIFQQNLMFFFIWNRYMDDLNFLFWNFQFLQKVENHEKQSNSNDFIILRFMINKNHKYNGKMFFLENKTVN